MSNNVKDIMENSHGPLMDYTIVKQSMNLFGGADRFTKEQMYNIMLVSRYTNVAAIIITYNFILSHDGIIKDMLNQYLGAHDDGATLTIDGFSYIPTKGPNAISVPEGHDAEIAMVLGKMSSKINPSIPKEFIESHLDLTCDDELPGIVDSVIARLQVDTCTIYKDVVTMLLTGSSTHCYSGRSIVKPPSFLELLNNRLKDEVKSDAISTVNILQVTNRHDRSTMHLRLSEIPNSLAYLKLGIYGKLPELDLSISCFTVDMFNLHCWNAAANTGYFDL